MRKLVYILIVSMVFMSLKGCVKLDQKHQKNRNLLIFNNDTSSKSKCTLTILKTDETLKYNYEIENGFENNMSFEYNLNADLLKFGLWDYKAISGSEYYIKELSKNPFKKYDLVDPSVDGTGPVIFNKKYGVLSIKNVLAPDFVFLPQGEGEKMGLDILMN